MDDFPLVPFKVDVLASHTASAESHPSTPLPALWPERLSASGDTEPFLSNLLLLVESHLLPPQPPPSPPTDGLQR